MPPSFPILEAAEAAALVQHGSQVALSGFASAGTPHAFPKALAARARREHELGRPFQIRLLSGASSGDADEVLSEAKAISWRAPYQTCRTLRQQINAGTVAFADLHLSHVPQFVDFGFAGAIDWAIVEATEITPDGRVYLTAGVGITPTILRHARRVIIEINESAAPRLREMHDIAMLPPPPHRGPIGITEPMMRIGVPYATVDPRKVVGIVRTNEPLHVEPFEPATENSSRIAAHLVEFLANESRSGRVPEGFLPIQAGVGNVSNAVIAAFGASPDVPDFEMFTEVLQDSQVELLERGSIRGVSTCSMFLSDAAMAQVVQNIDFFATRIVLRPQEFSNNPGIIRRLGVISINTVLEFDIYGCANSTHVGGTYIVNGIGGSGDFTRNAYLPILMCQSVALGGAVSTVVPMASHVDHTEHSTQVFVTEQGLADVRGLGPVDRARRIIESCAHPMYRDVLHRYLESSPKGHLRHDLANAFALHRNYAETGSMLRAGANRPPIIG